MEVGGHKQKMKSHGHLRKLYLHYRERYFGNTIPEDVPVCWSGEVSPKDRAHLAIRIEDDGTTSFEIHLDPVLRVLGPDWYKMALLHEMAHLKIYPKTKHGKLFDAEMFRLAHEGAFNGIW